VEGDGLGELLASRGVDDAHARAAPAEAPAGAAPAAAHLANQELLAVGAHVEPADVGDDGAFLDVVGGDVEDADARRLSAAAPAAPAGRGLVAAVHGAAAAVAARARPGPRARLQPARADPPARARRRRAARPGGGRGPLGAAPAALASAAPTFGHGVGGRP